MFVSSSFIKWHILQAGNCWLNALLSLERILIMCAFLSWLILSRIIQLPIDFLILQTEIYYGITSCRHNAHFFLRWVTLNLLICFAFQLLNLSVFCGTPVLHSKPVLAASQSFSSFLFLLTTPRGFSSSCTGFLAERYTQRNSAVTIKVQNAASVT